MKGQLLTVLLCGSPAVLSAPVLSKSAVSSSSSKDSGLNGLQDGPPVLIWRKFHSEEQRERAQEALRHTRRPTKTAASPDDNEVPITLNDLFSMRKVLFPNKPSTTQNRLNLPETPIATSVLLELSQQKELTESSPSAADTPISTKDEGRDQHSHSYSSIYFLRQWPRISSYYQRYFLTSKTESSSSTSVKSHIYYDRLPERTQQSLNVESWIVWISERPFWAVFALLGFLTVLFLISVVVVEIGDLIWRALRAIILPRSCEREVILSGPEKRLTAFPDEEEKCYHDDETILPPTDETVC